jgi:hypothetical protein
MHPSGTPEAAKSGSKMAVREKGKGNKNEAESSLVIAALVPLKPETCQVNSGSAAS